MQETPHGWTIIDADTGVYSYEYAFRGKSTSNTFVARYGGGKLLALSPACKLSDAAFAELDSFGTVASVVANNGLHHLGIAEWRRRYPNARFFASAETAKRIAKKNPEAGKFEPLSALSAELDGDVGVIEAPNTKCGETWAWAKTRDGYAWYASDTLANISALPPKFPLKQLFKWTKSGPGYSVFHMALMMIAKDKKRLLRTMADELQTRPASVMVPAHGPLLHQPGLADETQRLLQQAL